MNYEVNTESISIRNLDFEGCHEVPIDIDFSLPDYCPDIQRILKCQVCPNITVRNISGDRLNIEGTTNIRIIYLDSENMQVKCCENASPFAASIDIKSTPENAIAFTSIKVEYINCRAISPRKLDIHGAMSICAKIYSKSSKVIPCCINGKDIQQKIENKTTSNLVSIGQQQFSINETLDFDNNKPSPEMIIRSDILLSLNDYKTMPNKIVVKGEAILKILYIDNLSTGNLETMEYTIPISQIVDVPGAEENSRYIITGEILNHDEQIQSESEKNMINTEIKIAATVMAYQDKEIAIASDAYSTEYDLQIETNTIKISRLVDIIKEKFSNKSTLEIPGTDATKILDIWYDSCSAATIYQDSKIEFKIKMNVCILGIDTENVPFYLERIAEFVYEKGFENSNEDLSTEINVVPKNIVHNLTNPNSLDIKVDFDINGTLYEFQKCNIVVKATADESNLNSKDKTAALTIYYAYEGEPLWDIARRYYTSVNAIKRENNLNEDTAQENGMILIPMK